MEEDEVGSLEVNIEGSEETDSLLDLPALPVTDDDIDDDSLELGDMDLPVLDDLGDILDDDLEDDDV
jgi:hypothetical protein